MTTIPADIKECFGFLGTVNATYAALAPITEVMDTIVTVYKSPDLASVRDELVAIAGTPAGPDRDALVARLRAVLRRSHPAQPAAQLELGDLALNLSRNDRVKIQQQLTNLGYDTNGTDGSFGAGTRRAIALWQRDRNYPQTGALTRAQATEILQGRAPAAGGASSNAGAGSGGSAAQAEAVLNLSREQRRAVQAGLTRRGFDTRGVDGSFGRGTRNAIAAWQQANDLTATGYLTANQFERLTSR